VSGPANITTTINNNAMYIRTVTKFTNAVEGAKSERKPKLTSSSFVLLDFKIEANVHETMQVPSSQVQFMRTVGDRIREDDPQQREILSGE
jgi:hypothetical protein